MVSLLGPHFLSDPCLCSQPVAEHFEFVISLVGSFPRRSLRLEKPVEICSQLCNLSEWRRNEKYQLKRGSRGCSHTVQIILSFAPELPSESRGVRWEAPHWEACEEPTNPLKDGVVG